jgi:hypothetical protein
MSNYGHEIMERAGSLDGDESESGVSSLDPGGNGGTGVRIFPELQAAIKGGHNFGAPAEVAGRTKLQRSLLEKGLIPEGCGAGGHEEIVPPLAETAHVPLVI